MSSTDYVYGVRYLVLGDIDPIEGDDAAQQAHERFCIEHLQVMHGWTVPRSTEELRREDTAERHALEHEFAIDALIGQRAAPPLRVAHSHQNLALAALAFDPGVPEIYRDAALLLLGDLVCYGNGMIPSHEDTR